MYHPFTADDNFVVPAGVTSVTVEAWGAGGNGGTNGNNGAGGGGGGAYSKSVLAVTPGNSYAIKVGQGGAPQMADRSSSFATNVVVAVGGNDGSGTNGGAGGLSTNCIGTITYSGGNGGDGNSNSGGGGGSSASTSSNGSAGGDASGNTGGPGGASVGSSGAGGKGGNAGAAGADGTAFGGGGGGTGDVVATAGKGKNGQVIVTWDCPDNAGTLSGASHICSINGNATFSSTVPGGIWESSNPSYAEIHPTTGVVTAKSDGGGETVTITYSVASDGCTTKSRSLELIIDLLTIGTASSLPKVCINTPIPNITHTTTGVTGIYPATGLPAGVTAVWAANTITISGTPTKDGTFNYSIPVISTCGASDATGTIVVFSKPDVAATPASATICSGETTSIALTSSVSGTTFNWTVDQTGVTGAADGSGTSIAQTLTASGNIPGTATYTITPTANSCNGNPITVVVTVNPTPTVDAPSAQIVCNSQSTTAISFTGTVPSTVFRWTNNTPGIGLAANGTGGIPAFTAVNTGSSAVTATITVTPEYTNAGKICTGTQKTFTITVNPTPNVTATPASATICSGETTSIALTSNVGTSTFSWTVVQSGVSGATAGSGNSLAQILTTTGNTPGTATYTIIPSANGCSGNQRTVVITVNPVPTVDAPSAQIVCNSQSTTAINFTGTVPSTVFRWTNNTPGIGLAASGTGNIASFTAVNTGSSVVTATITVTPEYTNAGKSCSGTQKTFTITVNPTPNVTATPVSQTLCSGGTTSIALTSNVGTPTFSWTVAQSGVSGATSGSGNSIAQTLTTTGNTPGTATYTIIPSANSCSGSSKTVVITVNPTPTATASPVSQIQCSGTAINTIALSGSVSGTTFNWVRDNGANVTGIALSGTGDISGSLINTTTVQQTVKFTIIPTANGCTGAPIEASVVVHPKLSSVISVNGSSSICSGKTAELWITFTGSGPFRYAINNGPEVTATGNPEKLTVSPAANTTYTVTSLRDNYCVAPASAMTGTAAITVNPLPQLTSSLSSSVCSGKPFSCTPVVSIGGTTYKWTRATVPGISNASAEGTGSINEILTNTTNAPVNVVYAFELTSPNPQACTNNQNMVVTVNPAPDFTVSAVPLRACVGDPITISANPGSVSGYTYSLTYISDNSNIYPSLPTFADNAIGSFIVYPIVGKHTYQLTATNAQGCSYSQNVLVKVYDKPYISISPSCSEQSVTMNGTMIGTSSNPSNFTGSDLGRIEYSYDNGATWRTDTYWGPNLPLGVFSVLARNTAAIDINCSTSISANITLTSVLTQNVSVCQGLPAPSFSAVALCSGWGKSDQINNLNPPASSTYRVSSSANPPYTQGPLVNFIATDIFTVDKNNPQITFDDCNNKKGSNFSYSIYEYPFNAANPSHGFVTMVTACPKVTVVLDPNKYYQLVVNDYNINSNDESSIKFNGNDRIQVLNNTTEVVSWYKADGTFITTGNTFNPYPSIIANTQTPGNWKFYAACGTSTCRQEVNFTIDPIPTGSPVGSDQIITCSSQETNIQLKSVDKYGIPVPPGSVSYTWTTAIIAQDPSKITITHPTCTSGCSEIIRETITNSGTTTATVKFAITPKGGECLGEVFYVSVHVEPMPDFSITNTNKKICPSANPQIVPIQVVGLNSNLISGLRYIWSRTNTANLPASPAGAVPASGTEANPDGFTISGTLAGPFPNSFQTTVFTIEAQVNEHTCVTKTTAVTVGDETAPMITCPPNAASYDCISKVPAAATDYNSFVALGGTATDSCTAPPVVSHIGDALISGTNCNGVIRRTYRARDYAGNFSECSQIINIVNNSLPSFAITPPSTFDRCVYDITTAIFDPSTVDLKPNIDGSPARPDYYILTDADKAILSNITANSNCNNILHWKILDSNGNPIRDENSDLLQDKTDLLSSHPIKLFGNAANDVSYRLVYWLVDGCGRKSNDYQVVIAIKPRPVVNKL